MVEGPVFLHEEDDMVNVGKRVRVAEGNRAGGDDRSEARSEGDHLDCSYGLS